MKIDINKYVGGDTIKSLDIKDKKLIINMTWSKEQLDKALLQAGEALDKIGIPYFLFGGALLGLIREGELFPDDDLDFACMAKDITPEIKEKIKTHSNYRTESRTVSEHGQLSFNFNEIRVDLFPMYEFKDRVYMNQISKTGLIWPRHHIENMGKIKYLGKEWKTPNDVEGWLKAYYGNWRERIEDWKWHEDSCNRIDITCLK